MSHLAIEKCKTVTQENTSNFTKTEEILIEIGVSGL